MTGITSEIHSLVKRTGVDTGAERGAKHFVLFVHHDASHTFRYCKSLLMEVFGYDEDAACRHSWSIATEGKALVWSGKLAHAEQYCRMISEFQAALDARNTRLVEAEVDAGHPPLRTTIECVSLSP